MEFINRFVHELYLIILYKKIEKSYRNFIFYKKYDVADKVTQYEYSDIKFYVSYFMYNIYKYRLSPGLHVSINI